MADQAALRGQIAVVTGGGKGIGAAIAKRLAALGATAVITGRTREALERTAKEIKDAGGNCEPVACDVTSLEAVDALERGVEKKYGRCDVLVNNAGVGAFRKPLHELPPEDWDRVMNTNLRGVYYCIRAFAPMMIRANRGDIINISSIASKNALPKGAAYAASKWGLNGLSVSVAEELRGNNIRVSIICPGSTQTELSPHEGRDTSKMLQPEDIAHAVEALVTQTPQSFISEVVIRPTQKP